VLFWPQGLSLFKDIYAAIASSKYEYVCFFTDDDICFSEVPSIPYKAIFAEPYVTCVSLRLGLNICQRSHEGDISSDKIGEHYINGNIISWPRTSYLYGSYWSYSLSVDGHIFRKEDMINMIDELCYLESRYKWGHTPNVLESELQRFWATSPNFMIAPESSVVVNSPNNRVQESHPENRAGDSHATDSYFLLGKYLAGQRINLDYLNFNDIKCPHTEINILEGLNDI
tara:strand:+ start:276 stop:959 length:684 start_codon:yes stop_codon:yes gene_type:complete